MDRKTAVQELADQAVGPMGYELVDVEIASGGTLRVYIDSPSGIGLEDCEKVSRQLSHLLTVADVDYARLEVSSPGLDRPLRGERDFARFVGARVALRLKEAVSGRRNFDGVLCRNEAGAFSLELTEDEPAPKAPGVRTAGRKASARAPGKGTRSKAGVAVEPRVLSFTVEQVERARLVPDLRF